MLSIVVYGRNDDYGYNLHRRVALSLNCMAETLTNPDDEILFVDWNTPGRLPTLIEDLDDTLTDHCKSLLRVFKVSPEIHKQIAPRDLKRPTIEPFARNVGIRRSNPANKWLLSTNTDMVFDLACGSLSQFVAGLNDGYYTAYRYEIPEYLWARESRSNPEQFLSKYRKWAATASIERPIYLERDSHVLPEAPGDFQLAPREIWHRMKGFPENMFYGWHVDSAVSKLLIEEIGHPIILNDQHIKGAHCNHLRNLTHFHVPNEKINDFSAESKVTRSSDDWGLLNYPIEEIDLNRTVRRSVRWIENQSKRIDFSPTSASEIIAQQKYDVQLATTFLLDGMINLKSGSKIKYVGTNTDQKVLIQDFCRDNQLILSDTRLNEIQNPGLFLEECLDAKLLVFDFGLSFASNTAPDSANQYKNVLANSIIALAEGLRNAQFSGILAAVGPLEWPIRTLINGEFETPLSNNYGLVIMGPVRESSLIKHDSRFTQYFLRNAISDLSAGSSGRTSLVTRIARIMPKPLKRILRPLVYFLINKTKI